MEFEDLHRQEIRQDRLRRVYNSDSLASWILHEFKDRKTHVIEVDALVKRIGRTTGSPPDPAKVRPILAKLMEFGYGDLITGRRGHKTRFESRDLSLDQIWRLASERDHTEFVANGADKEASTGVDTEPEPVGTDVERETKVQPATSVAQTGEDDLFQHKFALRAGLQISVALPLDLTKAEADRLATFIKTLPFN